MPAPKGDFALVLRADAREMFANALDLLKQLQWPAADGKPEPLCLLCADVDFSGALVRADVLAADGSGGAFRVWIPHAFVMLAFDFERTRPVGFHG